MKTNKNNSSNTKLPIQSTAKLQQNPKWTLLSDNINSLLSDDMSLLIETGEPGMGKSYKTKQILQYIIPGKYTFFNCHITPLQFYAQLFKNKDKKIIVFDDIDTQNNKTIIALIKSACWNPEGDSRIIRWLTTSSKFDELNIPNEFVLNSKIILIFNDEDTSKEFRPVLNRGVHLPFNFTFYEKIREFEDIFNNSDIIDEQVLNYVKEKCSSATTNLSTRTIVILSNKKRSANDWEGTARVILKSDPMKELLIEMVNNSNGKKMTDVCLQWSKITGYNEKTFWNWKKVLIDNEKKVLVTSEVMRFLEPNVKEEIL